MVDSVQYRDDPVRRCASTDERLFDVSRDGDQLRKPREHQSVGGVINSPLAVRVARPAVYRGHRQGRRGLREKRGDHVSLVVVGMRDVDLALADETTELEPSTKIKRMTVVDLDVLD